MTIKIKSEAELTPSRRFSPETVARYFGRHSSAVEAAKLQRESPETYHEMRKLAVLDGHVSEQREHPWASLYRSKAAAEAPKQFTEQEIRCRHEFSEAEVRRYLTQSGDSGNKDNLSNLAKDTDRFERFQVAARSYGFSIGNHKKQESTTLFAELAPDDAGKIAVSDALADELHLPHGYKVPANDLSKLVALAAELKAQKSQVTE